MIHVHDFAFQNYSCSDEDLYSDACLRDHSSEARTPGRPREGEPHLHAHASDHTTPAITIFAEETQISSFPVKVESDHRELLLPSG